MHGRTNIKFAIIVFTIFLLLVHQPINISKIYLYFLDVGYSISILVFKKEN